MDWVTHLRTGGVHRRDAAGAGPVVLNIVRVMGAACSGKTPRDRLICARLLRHPLLVYSSGYMPYRQYVGGDICSTCSSSYLEGYWPCAGGFSAGSASDVQLPGA